MDLAQSMEGFDIIKKLEDIQVVYEQMAAIGMDMSEESIFWIVYQNLPSEFNTMKLAGLF